MIISSFTINNNVIRRTKSTIFRKIINSIRKFKSQKPCSSYNSSSCFFSCSLNPIKKYLIK